MLLPSLGPLHAPYKFPMTSPPSLARLQALLLPPFLDLYPLLIIALPISLPTPNNNLQVPILRSVTIHLSRIHPRAIPAVSHPFIPRNLARVEPLQNNIHNLIPC